MKCPICKGVGEIQEPSLRHHKDMVATKRAMAKKLIESGFSFRQVAKFLDYKSPFSISYLLK